MGGLLNTIIVAEYSLDLVNFYYISRHEQLESQLSPPLTNISTQKRCKSTQDNRNPAAYPTINEIRRTMTISPTHHQSRDITPSDQSCMRRTRHYCMTTVTAGCFQPARYLAPYLLAYVALSQKNRCFTTLGMLGIIFLRSCSR